VKYVIILIGDGMGANHLEAAASYNPQPAPFAGWSLTWAATYGVLGSYDPARAWTDFDYPKHLAADSAAAATAMFTGVKTANGRIAVTLDGTERLLSLAEKARGYGLGTGVATSSEISDATPGAWMAHNDRRINGLAIADEGLWGDPFATGTVQDSTYYDGSHGPTFPPLDVLIGGGHPGWQDGHYVNAAIRDKLFREGGDPGAFIFLERRVGQDDGGARLLSAADRPSVTRLAGLYGGAEGNLEYRLADGSGVDPENPTLAEMTTAALNVLGRNPSGFLLLVEGGSIDLASHDGFMDRMLGELFGFYEAAQAVIDWVDDPANDSTWDNTLVIVTADHETGYLTAGPGVFPDRPLGKIDPRTLALEKDVSGTGLRASWEDSDQNGQIDPGEQVYWCWNTTGHTNSLVPFFARGVGEASLDILTSGLDPVRGGFMQNTDLFQVAAYALARSRSAGAPPASPSRR